MSTYHRRSTAKEAFPEPVKRAETLAELDNAMAAAKPGDVVAVTQEVMEASQHRHRPAPNGLIAVIRGSDPVARAIAERILVAPPGTVVEMSSTDWQVYTAKVHIFHPN